MSGSNVSDSEWSEEDLDLKKTVEKCFKQITVPPKHNYHQYSRSQTSQNGNQIDSDSESVFGSGNIFQHYDVEASTCTGNIERKLNKSMNMLKRQSKKIRRLEKILFGKKRETVLKPRSIRTSEGRRYSCTLCNDRSNSYGKACAHIAKFHTGIKLFCDSCTFQTYNPDSLNKHRKKHVN